MNLKHLIPGAIAGVALFIAGGLVELCDTLHELEAQQTMILSICNSPGETMSIPSSAINEAKQHLKKAPL